MKPNINWKNKNARQQAFAKMRENGRDKEFRVEVVRDFKRMGFEVELKGQAYCFAESITVNPQTREYEILKTGEKGSYKGQNANQFIRQFFGLR